MRIRGRARSCGCVVGHRKGRYVGSTLVFVVASADTPVSRPDETWPRPGRQAAALKKVLGAWLDRYHRLTLSEVTPPPDRPCLFVSHHGFGGAADLNVMAAVAVAERVSDRPLKILGHAMIYKLRAGGLLGTVGAIPAGKAPALEALAAGYNVLVMPGGDLDAARPFPRRHELGFFGRRGFVRVAQEAGVPIVPIVVAGASESLLVLSDGQQIARALRLDKTLRLKAFPISLSVPWGLGLGVVGMIPYLALPTQLEVAVLSARDPAGQDPDAFADELEAEMQAKLTAITRDRIPVVGRLRR